MLFKEKRLANKDLGTKLNCQKCEAKFYDLNKKNPTCPKCGAEYVPAKTRNRRLTVKTDQPAEVVPAVKLDNSSEISSENIDDIEVEVENVGDVEEDNSTLMEDTSDMGDDQTDIAGVIVNKDDSSEGI